jgi:hypothetical protein
MVVVALNGLDHKFLPQVDPILAPEPRSLRSNAGPQDAGRRVDLLELASIESERTL